MKQLFHIENGLGDNGQQVLSLRLGARHGSFAITNKSGTELHQLAYCATDEWNEKELTEFMATYPSLNNPFYEVLVSYDFPESLFISSGDYKMEDAGLLLAAVAGNSSTTNTISELITGWQLYNVYAVAKEMQEWLSQKFPAARCRHQYSLGIKNVNAADADGSITVDFRTDVFTIIAAKGSKLLLAQTFEYSTLEDVLYYLLQICQQFSLSQQEVKLHVSGLIDKQSSLYKELYQYFINLGFREARWNAGNEYPAHFFTSLNDLARCAS